MNYAYFQKYLLGADHRIRFKKQCLKSKNILFENEQLQIGCKVVPLYDIYTSSNYLQVNLFIGNKTDKPIDSFKLDFRGSPNLNLFVEQKNRSIKERTQYKERLVLGCANYEEECLILMDFQSHLATLKNTPLPITLYNFCSFSPGQNVPSSIHNEADLTQLLGHKYEYVEEHEISVGCPFFKKNLISQIQKYFNQLSKICEGVYIGHFFMKQLYNEYAITLKVISDKSIKICLASNEYQLFDQLFYNLRFLLE